jgi:Undecaprenyl-phosphate glucose phosphotransferase
MLKKHGQLFFSSLVLFDSLAIALSWLLAYYVRFHWQIVPLFHPVPQFSQYLWALIPILAVFMVNIKLMALYQPLRGKPGSSETISIIKVASISVLMLTAITFFYRSESFSRVVAVYFWLFVIAGMLLSHHLVGRLLAFLRKRGLRLQRVLVVGAGALGQKVVESLCLHPEIGFSVEGYLTGHAEQIGTRPRGVPVVGLYQDVSRVIREMNIDQLFIALPLKSHDRLEQVLSRLKEETVAVKVVPDLLRYMNIHSGVDELDGLPIVNLAETPLYGWNLVIKRGSDIVLGSLALLFLSPLMALIALAVKLESPGPVFFRQERMGLDGKVFNIIKFRSMRVDAEEETGPMWTKEEDPRRTRVGSVLRRISLDELPQLFNVLKGEMSLVGPRPERPVFIDEFKKSIPHYMLRMKMKAGLTGWAQVNGWRGNTSLKERIACDIYYIQHWSLWFDLKILLLTLVRGFFHRHAY